MRFTHPDGSTVHLAYCSNVHPSETAEGVAAQLSRFAAPVRARLGVDSLGVGLWLAAPAAQNLLEDPRALSSLCARLEGHGLEVVTLNGFPYTAFHAPVVKKAVYSPDWTDPRRAEYTLTLARLLARLLPDGVETGTISTVPLGWREDWTGEDTRIACDALNRVAEGLEALADESGRRILLALEPEPGCAVETTEGLAEALEGVDGRWVGACLDACHMAVQFEEPAKSVNLLKDAGVPIFKAQLSSALKVADPVSPRARETLEGFAEPRFLHQTRERTLDGVAGVDDLPEALAGGLPGSSEWRVHFHVPIHHPGEDTTQRELVEALDALVGGEEPVTRHLEVETYTWTVLPRAERPTDDDGLIEGLARELAWTKDRLDGLGLRAPGNGRTWPYEC